MLPKKIKIFGYVITEDARHSFNQSKNYYISNGGCYEICEFKIPEMYSDSSSDEEIKYKRKKCKKSKEKKCKKKNVLKMKKMMRVIRKKKKTVKKMQKKIKK